MESPSTFTGLLIHLKETAPGSPGESTALNLRVRKPLLHALDKQANRFGRNRSDLARMILEIGVAELAGYDVQRTEDGRWAVLSLDDQGNPAEVVDVLPLDGEIEVVA